MSNVWIVGFGRVGHLVYAIEQQLSSIVMVFTKTSKERIVSIGDKETYIKTYQTFFTSTVDRIWICTPEYTYFSILKELADLNVKANLAIHTSGWHSPKILEPIVIEKGDWLSFHPMVSIQPKATHLKNAYVSLCGTDGGIEFGKMAAKFICAHSFIVSEADKKTLHLLCQFAANVPYALFAAALELGQETKISHEILFPAIKQMMNQVFDSITTDTIHPLITGPIARGDLEFVQMSLEFLQTRPHLLKFYIGYVQYLTTYLLHKGVPYDKLQQLQKIQQTLEGMNVSAIMD
ncbi:MAG: DUF2520 domain-containing protein [bacterium]|nr:DUF2520 domain-containing protein [bacterium]